MAGTHGIDLPEGDEVCLSEHPTTGARPPKPQARPQRHSFRAAGPLLWRRLPIFDLAGDDVCHPLGLLIGVAGAFGLLRGQRHSPILLPHPHIGKGAGTLEGAMEYLLEAKKFIQRAREAYTSEARKPTS